MKKIRGIAALFLAFAIMATSGLALIPVYAEGEEIASEEVVSEEVVSEETVEDAGYQVTADDVVMLEKLEAFGIISDTNVDLTRIVTRREVAEIIVGFMKFSVSSENYTASPNVSGFFGLKISLHVITVTRSSVSLRLIMLCVQPGIM